MNARCTLPWLVAAAIVAGIPATAAQVSILRAVRGTAGYQVAKDAPFTRVFGSLQVNDDQFAITRAASNALLVLADSSEVALGESTNVQVGQISQIRASTPTAITLVAGAMRFAVKHPAGGQANYRFQTNTSQIAVRGTIGLYATGPNGDVVSCLECSPGDVTVTAGGKSFALLTGQTASISSAGVATVSATSAETATSFAHAGLSTTANSATPFAAGIHAVAATAGTAGSTAAIAGVAGAAAAAGVAATANSGNQSTPAPSPPPTFTQAPVPTPTPIPIPTPTPTHAATPSPAPSQSASFGVYSRARAVTPESNEAPAVRPPNPAIGMPPFGGRR